MEFFFILKLNFDMSDLTLIVLQDQFGQFKQFQQIFFVYTSDLLNVLTYILSKWYDYYVVIIKAEKLNIVSKICLCE